jgi:hypothetical protein
MRIGQKIAVRTAANANGSEFVIFGAGQNNYGPSDDFFFVQQSSSNSVDFAARLRSADGFPASRHGIMIRESEKADAPFAFVGLSQSTIAWLHRDAPSQYSQITKVPPARLPIFLRLLKKTNFISGAYSTNGTHWVWLETNQIPFSAQSYLIGFAVSSGSDMAQAGSTFDAITITNH